MHDGHAWKEFPRTAPAATRRAIQAANTADATLLVHASFAFVHAVERGARIDEPLRSCVDAILECEAIALSGPLPACVVRLGYLYGPESADLLAYRKAFRLGRPYWSGRSHARQYHIHQFDAASALLAVARPKNAGKIYYATDGHAISFERFMDAFARRVGRPRPLHLPLVSHLAARVIIREEHMQQTALGMPPRAPSPRLEITSTGGLGFLVVAPTGQACGPTGNKAEIFGCVVSADKVTIREPAAGRWGLFMTSTGAVPLGTLSVDGFIGTTRNAGRTTGRPYAAGDMVRTGLTLTPGPPLALTAFEPPTLVTSVCAAAAAGRVFATGPVDGRADSIRTFARDNKATPVSLVFTEAELNDAVNKNAPSPTQGVTLSDAKITIDAGGIHGTAKAATQFITVNASADVVGGPVGDKFTLKVSRLAADPLPPGLIDAMKGLVDSSTADISGTVPFLVKQVAFRNGCFWVSGVTPN